MTHTEEDGCWDSKNVGLVNVYLKTHILMDSAAWNTKTKSNLELLENIKKFVMILKKQNQLLCIAIFSGQLVINSGNEILTTVYYIHSTQWDRYDTFGFLNVIH